MNTEQNNAMKTLFQNHLDSVNVIDPVRDSLTVLINTPVEQLNQLDRLNLNFSGVDDEMVSSLTTLESLTSLSLSHTRFTDLSILKELKTLSFLDITYAEVTDISPLTELTNLTTLYFGDLTIDENTLFLLAKVPLLTEVRAGVLRYTRSIGDNTFVSESLLDFENEPLEPKPVEIDVDNTSLINLGITN